MSSKLTKDTHTKNSVLLDDIPFEGIKGPPPELNKYSQDPDAAFSNTPFISTEEVFHGIESHHPLNDLLVFNLSEDLKKILLDYYIPIYEVYKHQSNSVGQPVSPIVLFCNNGICYAYIEEEEEIYLIDVDGLDKRKNGLGWGYSPERIDLTRKALDSRCPTIEILQYDINNLIPGSNLYSPLFDKLIVLRSIALRIKSLLS